MQAVGIVHEFKSSLVGDADDDFLIEEFRVGQFVTFEVKFHVKIFGWEGRK